MKTERRVRAVLLVFAALSTTAACAPDPDVPYLERRAAFATKLTKVGPAPDQDLPMMYSADWELPAGSTEEVRYTSDDLELKAWVFVPESARATAAPALVYLHSGAGGANEATLRDAKLFLEEGFVVMVPTFRGAKDNPGHFEFMLGEVDDAAAASRWLARQPYVDGSRVYALGWSAGGVISSLLSLMDDVPIRHSAGSGGLADPSLFEMVEGEGLLPFDRTDLDEVELRLLLGNIRWMQRRHYAYIGSQDTLVVPSIAVAQREMAGEDSLLEIIMLPGDHASGGAVAMEAYRDLVREGIRSADAGSEP